MQKLISVVVPFFNGMNFLERSLQSLESQTDRDFEVVLVDDGSVDGSGEWATGWVEKHPKFHLVRQTNQGVSSARNLGLSKARGSWVLFVDADDTVEPDFVAAMREAGNQNDLAVCAYETVGLGETRAYILSNGSEIDMDLVYEHTLCTAQLNGGCCNKLFRMEVIREHGLHFNTSLSVGEDMVFLADYFQHCRTVAYVDRVLYHYTVNSHSLTQSAISLRQVSARDASVLMAMDGLVELLQKQSPKVRGYGDFRRVRSSLRLLFQMVLSDTREPLWLSQMARHCRAGWMTFCRSPHARWVECLTVISFMVAPNMLFSMASFLARRRPQWVAGFRG